MSLPEIISVAWEGIASNKLRSLLTMLGVIIGVAAVIIMIAVSAGTEATIEEQITGLGSNLIYINSAIMRVGFAGGGGASLDSRGGLVYDDAFAIADAIGGVAGVVVEQSSSTTVKYGNVVLDSVTIFGTMPDFPSVRDIDVADGRFFTERELERKTPVAVLGYTLAQELFGEEDPIGQYITAGSTRMVVIGIMEEKGTVSGADFDSNLYTPVTVVFQKFTPSMMARVMGDSVRAIYVEIDEDAVMDDVILQIELLLARRHGVTLDEPDFSITTQDDVIETQASATEAFRTLLAWVAGVSLLVGGIGIMNIMLVSVTERTREIGLRQAIGATPNDVRMQFLAEALLLSLVGGLLGVLAGVGGSWLFGELGGMRTVVVPASILLAFGSAATVGIFFGYFPANKAARLDPIEALRYE